MYRQLSSLTISTVDLAIKAFYPLMTGVTVALVVPFSLTYSYFWTRYDFTTFYFVLISRFLFFFSLHIWLGSPIGPKTVLFIVTSYRAKKVIIHPEASLRGYQADIQDTRLKKRNFTG